MFGFTRKNNAASTATSPTHPNDNSGLNPSRRTSSEPILITPDLDDNNGRQYTEPTKEQKKKFKNDFSDSGGLENQSVQELETYAVYKSEETTNSVNNCLRIAEDIREDASKTLETLHQHGEQIHRTHQMAAGIDQDLSKGEKLLNSLGGMFSKTWKPKKTRNITGPLITPDEPAKRATKEQKDKLMASVRKGKTSDKTPPSGAVTAMQKVEMEKEKQDEALGDLSNILGYLKGMAIDMGGELEKCLFPSQFSFSCLGFSHHVDSINTVVLNTWVRFCILCFFHAQYHYLHSRCCFCRQNKALDHLDKDIDELNSRVKGANQRAHHLLNK